MTKQPKIALICLDRIGRNMAGPGIRYVEMARSLSKHFPVVLLAPENDDSGLKINNVELRIFTQPNPNARLFPLIRDCGTVIAQSLRPGLLLKIKKAGISFIADLYDPIIIETIEYFKQSSPAFQKHNFNFQRALLLLQLQSCDFFLAANERQRSFYLGLMAGEKIINPASYFSTPRTDYLSSLVPFGLPENDLRASDPGILEKTYPQIKATDKIVYWGGGVWNWLDALSVVKAIENISKKRRDVKLFFIGIKHPNPKIKEMEMMKKTLEYTKEHKLQDTFIFMNFGWTPYEERVNYLKRASIGISTHFENLETHFSFRTRVLDYLWAELPMILTKGDFMAELCERHNLGRVVGYEDIAGIEQAILELCDESDKVAKIKDNIRKVKADFTWDAVTAGIVDFIKKQSEPAKPAAGLRFRTLVAEFYKSGVLKKIKK